MFLNCYKNNIFECWHLHQIVKKQQSPTVQPHIPWERPLLVISVISHSGYFYVCRLMIADVWKYRSFVLPTDFLPRKVERQLTHITSPHLTIFSSCVDYFCHFRSHRPESTSCPTDYWVNSCLPTSKDCTPPLFRLVFISPSTSQLLSTVYFYIVRFNSICILFHNYT